MVNTSKLHPDFGAEVHNIDLASSFDDTQRDAIADALETYGMLLFREQSLDEDMQIAMAKRFGTLDSGFKKASKSPNRFSHDELLDMSNVDVKGDITARNHPKVVGNIANQLWHSDSSFQAPATAYSMLLAVVVPSSGGDTEFVDCRVAYETLPADQQRALRGLIAKHHALHSRIMLGDDQYTDTQRQAIPPAEWPILKPQKSTGRTALFVGAHAHEVIGMTVPEGRMLLMDLLEHATRPDRVYLDTVGDPVISSCGTTERPYTAVVGGTSRNVVNCGARRCSNETGFACRRHTAHSWSRLGEAAQRLLDDLLGSIINRLLPIGVVRIVALQHLALDVDGRIRLWISIVG